jgi:hypothetical protein
MVNNFTVIDKTSNHLNSPNIKIGRLHMPLEIQVLYGNRNKKCGGVKSVNGITTLPSCIVLTLAELHGCDRL